MSDALGSVRQLVNSDGQVTLARGYTPYGEPLWSEGTGQSAYGYTCEAVDVSTGLVFLRARYMQPTLGMFLSRDPWSGNEMWPGSMNGWNYGEGNPINLTDPTGWCKELPLPFGQYLDKIVCIVERDDNLWLIGQKYGLTVDAILTLNPQFRANPRLIFRGNYVWLPNPKLKSPSAPTDTIPRALGGEWLVDGYLYGGYWILERPNENDKVYNFGFDPGKGEVCAVKRVGQGLETVVSLIRDPVTGKYKAADYEYSFLTLTNIEKSSGGAGLSAYVGLVSGFKRDSNDAQLNRYTGHSVCLSTPVMGEPIPVGLNVTAIYGLGWNAAFCGPGTMDVPSGQWPRQFSLSENIGLRTITLGLEWFASFYTAGAGIVETVAWYNMKGAIRDAYDWEVLQANRDLNRFTTK